MNNLICIFFGHKDDKLLFEKDKLSITNCDITIARFTMCKRCNTVYLRTVKVLEMKSWRLEKND